MPGSPYVPAEASWPEEVRAEMTVYRSGYDWCKRCDVGWMGPTGTKCWLCGQDDAIYRWTYRPKFPEFRKVEAHANG